LEAREQFDWAVGALRRFFLFCFLFFRFAALGALLLRKVAVAAGLRVAGVAGLGVDLRRRGDKRRADWSGRRVGKCTDALGNLVGKVIGQRDKELCEVRDGSDVSVDEAGNERFEGV